MIVYHPLYDGKIRYSLHALTEGFPLSLLRRTTTQEHVHVRALVKSDFECFLADGHIHTPVFTLSATYNIRYAAPATSSFLHLDRLRCACKLRSPPLSVSCLRQGADEPIIFKLFDGAVDKMPEYFPTNAFTKKGMLTAFIVGLGTVTYVQPGAALAIEAILGGIEYTPSHILWNYQNYSLSANNYSLNEDNAADDWIPEQVFTRLVENNTLLH